MRDLPANFASQLDQRVVAPALFLHLDWPQGPVYVWSGYGPIDWGGRTWQGVGDLGGISQVGESSDLRANGVRVTLSGIPGEVLIRAFDNEIQGAKAELFLGVFDPQGALITAPWRIFDGVVDTSAFEENGDTSTVTVMLEKELVDRRDDVRRFTHEDQQIEYPGDLFFEYVPWLAQNPIQFGKYKSGQGAQLVGWGRKGLGLVPLYG